MRPAAAGGPAGGPADCAHTCRVAGYVAGCADYGDPVFDLNGLDLEEIATALADQTDYEHRWLINPQTGEVVFWTSDTGIDGQTPVDLDELDLISIDPLPSYIWYQDMADFAGQITDEKAGRRLAHVIQGRGRRAARVASAPDCAHGPTGVENHGRNGGLRKRPF